MASLEVPNSIDTDALLARLIGASEVDMSTSSNGAILSRKGTVRGVQDNVKNTVQNFKKMKVKPEASPMLRRVMEVSIEALDKMLILLCVGGMRERSGREAWTSRRLRDKRASRQDHVRGVQTSRTDS